jgi:hypothetical protein
MDECNVCGGDGCFDCDDTGEKCPHCGESGLVCDGTCQDEEKP